MGDNSVKMPKLWRRPRIWVPQIVLIGAGLITDWGDLGECGRKSLSRRSGAAASGGEELIRELAAFSQILALY